jgi:hypothetical protein
VNEEGSKVEAFEDGKSVLAAKVERPEEGVYCISSLGFTPHNVVVTPDGKESVEPFFASTTVGKSHHVEKEGLCGSTAPQITVEIWQSETPPHKRSAPFYLEIN